MTARPLPPLDALQGRPGISAPGPDPTTAWWVEVEYPDEVAPDGAELERALGPAWRARHHHPDVWAVRGDRWEAPQGAAPVTRLVVSWDLTQPDPPDAQALQGRVGALAVALSELGPAKVSAALPPAVGAGRAAGLARLRARWGTPVAFALVGADGRGLDPAGAWLHLRDAGLRPLPDGTISYGGQDPAGPPPPLRVRTRGPPGRLDPALLMGGDLRLLDLVFEVAVAVCPAPRRALDAALGLADDLARALRGEAVSLDGGPLDRGALGAEIDLCVAGLARHGLRPGQAGALRVFKSG